MISTLQSTVTNATSSNTVETPFKTTLRRAMSMSHLHHCVTTPMFARLVQEAQQEHDRETDIEEARRWQEDNAINWLQSQNLSHDEYTQWLRTYNQQEIEKKIARGKAMRENLDPWRAKYIQDFRE